MSRAGAGARAVQGTPAPSPDWAIARRRMVAEQLRGRSIRDERVLEAMARIPRHRFVEEALVSRAYGDSALPIGEGQSISQPYMVALMSGALGLRGGERVLEIGTGSGYQTAVLAELAEKVFSVERVRAFAERAQHRLGALGYYNVRIRVGDGSLGWPEEAPFDAILVTAGAPRIPEALMAQLAPGGCLVVPVGPEASQVLRRVVHRRDGHAVEDLTGCTFVKLVGEGGWQDV